MSSALFGSVLIAAVGVGIDRMLALALAAFIDPEGRGGGPLAAIAALRFSNAEVAAAGVMRGVGGCIVAGMPVVVVSLGAACGTGLGGPSFGATICTVAANFPWTGGGGPPDCCWFCAGFTPDR